MSQDDSKTKKQLLDELAKLRGEVLELSKVQDVRQALMSRDKLFQRAEEISQVGSFVVDLSTGEMRWSDQVYRLLGMKPGGMKPGNETFWKFVHSEDRDRLIEEAGRVFAGETDMDIKYRIVRSDGELRHVHTHADREFDEQGNLEYIWGYSQDITERKQAEEALRESESRFRSLAEASHEGVLITEAGVVVEANSQIAEMLGYSSEELIGIPLKDLVAPKSWESVAQHVSTNSQEAFELLAMRKDGSTFDAEGRGETITYKGKQVRVSAVRDITETKRLQELESRAQRLETAGTIAGQVAHDFNNLLAPLMGYPDFIRDELPHDHKALPYLDDMERAARKIADINQELLTLSRRGFYNRVIMDLNPIVLRTIKEIQPLASEVAYDTKLPEDLMPIKGGNAQIHRILNNLLMNAADAVQNTGRITVTTENYYADDTAVAFGRVPKGEYVKMTVTDTGCGIPEEIAQKIFDPFFTTKTTDKTRGSGLGLSVVDSVMKDHDGYIDMKSTVGQGSSFYLYFPIARDRISNGDELVDNIGGNETVLIIDDDRIQREVSAAMLGKLGYKVTTIESGEKAVDLLRKTPHDLLILDMIMPPGIDGAETYRRVLAINPDQKAIIVSGFSESKQTIETQRLGAGAFIKKPLSKVMIAAAVRKELDRQPKSSMR